MKGLVKSLFLLGLGTMLFFTSCKDDPANPAQDDFKVLTEYMVQNNLDLADVLNGWVTAGSALNLDQDFAVVDYYVIDIRSAEDYDAGHIKNAVNASVGNVLNEARNANGKPILVVCYTGQTAARAVGALRLMGYEAKSLKWGMSAWHSDLAGKWNANATDYASPNWTKSGVPPTNGTFAYPSFSTSQPDGASILEARVNAALNNTSWGVKKDAVLSNPGDYFINNKWPIESWDAYGHIDGAYRIDENLGLSGLDLLDPNKPMITYCYTGQTSAITSLWLEVLGYNAKSLMFGVNGINHSELSVGSAGSAHKKSWKGEGSGSELNYGYYDSDGNFHTPQG